MLRRTLVVVGMISLCGLLIALGAPAKASSRTLHPNELWTAYGGQVQNFDDRCCDPIQRCEPDMELCDFIDTDPPCSTSEEHAHPPQGYQDKGCNAGPQGTLCTEDLDTVACLYIYECDWNEMMEECSKGQQTDTESAPKGCADDCPPEDP